MATVVNTTNPASSDNGGSGFISGSIASFIAPSSQGGIIAMIVLGIIGAVVGGYLGERFFDVGVTGFNLQSFTIAVIGSLIVISVGNLLLRK